MIANKIRYVINSIKLHSESKVTGFLMSDKRCYVIFSEKYKNIDPDLAPTENDFWNHIKRYYSAELKPYTLSILYKRIGEKELGKWYKEYSMK